MVENFDSSCLILYQVQWVALAHFNGCPQDFVALYNLVNVSPEQRRKGIFGC